jgi:hypothetical protein
MYSRSFFTLLVSLSTALLGCATGGREAAPVDSAPEPPTDARSAPDVLDPSDAGTPDTAVSPEPDASPVPDASPDPDAEPTPTGPGSVTGRLMSRDIGPPFYFYLRPAPSAGPPPAVWHVHASEADGEIPGMSEADGTFVVNDVPAGEYYIVIWLPPYDIAVGLAGSSLLRIRIAPGETTHQGDIPTG